MVSAVHSVMEVVDKQYNPPLLPSQPPKHFADGVHTAKHVVTIPKEVVENSEDSNFKMNLDTASDSVTTGMYESLSQSLFSSRKKKCTNNLQHRQRK